MSYQQPYNPHLPWPGQASLPEPPPKKPTIRPWMIVSAALVAVTAIILTVVLTGNDNGGSNAGLERIQQSCGLSTTYAVLGDSGRTLTLDGEGKEDSGGLSVSDIECALEGVKMPASVRGQLDNTRALDGMQHASWDIYSATWNYHPDSGVNLIITSVR